MNKKKEFIRYLINFFVFVTLEVAAILLIYNNSIVQRSEMMDIVNTVNGFFAKTINRVISYFSLKETNEKLSAENSRLNEEIWIMKESFATQNLPDLIKPAQSPFTFIPAQIISNHTGKLHNAIIINKGYEDGICEGMGIITELSIIGYVQNSTKHYSKVVSLLDKDNAISATIKRNNTFGIVKWNGKSIRKITLYDIPIHTEFKTGDTVVSSGYSAMYPPNIPIGIITGNYTQDGTNYNIELELFENYKKLKYVYAVKVRDMEEIKSLTDY